MTDVSNIDPDIEAADAPTGYDYASIKAQATYDSRNDLFFPTRGQRGFFSAEYADSFLGSQITLTRLTGGMRYFIPLTTSTVLGMRYQSGLIVPGETILIYPFPRNFSMAVKIRSAVSNNPISVPRMQTATRSAGWHTMSLI